MKMKNKEAIEKMMAYFMNQEKEDVCRLVANNIIDLNRFYNYRNLPFSEKNSLMFRTEANMKQIFMFLNDELPEGQALTLSRIEDVVC